MASAASAASAATLENILQRNGEIERNDTAAYKADKRTQDIAKKAQEKTGKLQNLQGEVKSLKGGAKTLNQTAKGVAILAGAIGAFVLAYALLKNHAGISVPEFNTALNFLESNKVAFGAGIPAAFIGCLGGSKLLSNAAAKKQKELSDLYVTNPEGQNLDWRSSSK